MRKAWLFILGFLLLHACIDIQDKIAPSIDIGQFKLLDQYQYLDTLKVGVILEDNSSIDCVLITIRSVNPLPGGNNWSYQEVEKGIQSRVFERLVKIPVPAFIVKSQYEFKVENFDADLNSDVFRDTFAIIGDATPPVIDIQGIGLSPLPNGAENEFIACRRDRLTIRGTALDNIQLDRIGYTLSGPNIRTENFSVAGNINPNEPNSLETIFGQLIGIPQDALDNKTAPLTLTIKAIDFEGNESNTDFKIFVDCDDQLPTIQIAQSLPAIVPIRDTEGRVVLSQGSALTFEDIQVNDNRYIDSAVAYFRINGEVVKQWNKKIGASNLPMNLVDAFRDNAGKSLLTVPIEKDASILSSYSFEIGVVDSVNTTTFSQYLVNIEVVKDEAPFLEGFAVTVTSNPKTENEAFDYYLPNGDEAFTLTAGQSYRISFEGKVKDDYNLKQVVVFINNEDVVTKEDNLGLNPYSLSENYEDLTIEIANDEAAGTSYTFRLEATDSLGQKTSIVLTFTIQ